MFDFCKWSIAVLSLAGVVLNIRRQRACFLCWLVSNASWAVVDTIHGIYPQALLQLVYVGLSVYGFRKWKPPTGVTQ